jgi:hypothetical protein
MYNKFSFCTKCFLLVLLNLFSSDCFSQSIRYMDESGNLHFVDSIYQVPPRYRNQVLQPTPVPTGKIRPTPKPRPTKTPKPLKAPKMKPTKVVKPKKPAYGLAAISESAPGQLPTQASAPQKGGLKPPPLPFGNAPVAPAGVPSGLIAPGAATSSSVQ